MKKESDIIKWMVGRVSETLSVPTAQVNIDDPFFNLGLNSIDIVDLSKSLELWLDCEIEEFLFFEHTTIRALSKYLASVKPAEIHLDQVISSHEFNNTPIAIIGMDCNFPSAPDLTSYWDLLINKKSGVQEIPKNHFKRPLGFKSYAGLINNDYHFDQLAFKVSTEELKHMDPQQKLLLSLSWGAIEDAGYSPKELDQTNTGVFIGISTSDFVLEKVLEKTKASVFDGTGFAHSIAANRISYTYNLKGPSLSLDTACSSSLVALHQAIQSMRIGESEMALVGGINIINSPFLTQSFQKANMLSKNGNCFTFSKEADGYVRGEGGGMVLLKPLSKALADGNTIYSVIKGTAVNQDGQTSSLTAPNLSSQVEVLGQALKSAKQTIDDIQYIEAHGTGTPLGDPIEIEAIKRIYKNKIKKLSIGSVKTNIGHLESAAGIAGLIKMSLSIKNKIIPSQINFSELNPKINLAGTQIEILNEHLQKGYDVSKAVGLSSFGFGGTNSHIIMGAPPSAPRKIEIMSLSKKITSYPIILSATNIESLIISLTEISKSHQPIEYISKELMYRFNKNLAYQFTATVNTKSDLKSILEDVSEKKNESQYISYNQKSHSIKVAFVFTGQGSEYNKMGLELYENFNEFRKVFNELIDRFEQKLGFTNLLEIWLNSKKISDTKYSQILLFCYQCSFIELLKLFNIKADIHLGHSFGEITASYASGMLSQRNAVELISQRSTLLAEAKKGMMLVVFDSIEKIKKVIDVDDKKISLAAMNSENINVLSGEKDSIKIVQEKLKNLRIRTKVLSKENAFHSYVIDDLSKRFVSELSEIKHLRAHSQLISCFEGETLIQEPAKYWSKHLRTTTNFKVAMHKLIESGPSHIIEIGPTPTLIPLIRMEQKNKKSHCDLISSDNPDIDSTHLLFNILYKLVSKRFDINFKPLLRNYQRKFLKLPISQIQKVGKQKISHRIDYRNENMSHPKNYVSELISLISSELEIPINEIDSKSPLIDLGSDSLVLLNCLETINEKYQVEITMADVFNELTTIEEVANYLKQNVEIITIDQNQHMTNQIIPKLETEQSSEVKELIQQQLNIMKMQLKALGQIPPTKDIKQKNNFTTLNKDNVISGKGVLGNFSSSYQSKSEDTSKYISELINKFNERTKKSKLHTEKYRKSLTDNRVSAGFRPNIKEAVYPIHFNKASGAYFWDIDNNKYTDFTMGFGVNLFGHSPDFINKSVKKQLETGVAVGPQTELAGPVAELFCKVTQMERVTFVNSGTEAVMTAMRLARAKTKKETIVIFEGSYHGHFDGVLARKNSAGKSLPVSAGVPHSLTDGIVVLDYNQKESLDYIRDHAHNLAGVLIEGVQSRFPELRPKEFILELRKITASNDVALIVDEVINGFRIHPRGIQGECGFKADIATYGKILGGGFPIGAVAGSHQYLDFIDGGHWNFGDESYPPNEITFFAGTFCKHPLAMCATFEVLKKMDESGLSIIADLNKKTEKLSSELNSFFNNHQIDIQIVYYGSLFRFKYKKNIDWLFYLLNHKGFYIWEGRNMFISTAHSEEDINNFIVAIKESVLELVKEGHIISNNKSAQKETSKTVQMIATQKRFSKLTISNNQFDKLSAQIAACIELKGHLNVDVLKKSITDTLERYDSFSAKYFPEKETITFGVKNIIKASFIDLSSIDEPEENAHIWLKENALSVLDPSSQPIKIDILKIKDDKYFISFLAHHLTCDGLSIAFMIDEFAKSYNAGLKNIKPTYSKLYHFSHYMNDYHNRLEKLDQSKEFWEERLKERTPKIWDTTATSKKGKRIKQLIKTDQYKKIRMFGYKNKSSLQNTLLIYFCEVIANHYNKNSIIIGVPAAGHTSIKETCVGQCVNIVPITWKKTELNIKEKIERLKESQLKSYKHSDYPIDKMEEFTKSHLIEVLFNVEPINELPHFNGVTTDLINVPISASEYPIIINAMRLDTELHIEMDYQCELINDDEAKIILDKFINKLPSL